MKSENLYPIVCFLFPYEKISIGEEVVIYGAGKVGMAYLQQIEKNNYCKIKYIVDSKLELSVINGYSVKRPEFLRGEKARIVIAIDNKEVVKEVIESIKSQGIKEEHIVWKSNHVECVFDIDEAYKNRKNYGKRLYFNCEEFKDLYGKETYDFMKQIRNQLKIYRCKTSLARIGGINDGGYVMADSFKESGIAYSFGISNDVQWDACMADRNYQIFMYDHTIENIPYRRKEFHFFKKGIADNENQSGNLNPLEYYLDYNGHQNNKDMVLKMDVEGAEYGFVRMVKEETLRQFDQIIMEIHGINDRNRKDDVLELLKKIMETHVPIHIHSNNYGDVIYIDDVAFPDTIEVAFVNKQKYEYYEDDDLIFPRELDAPNWSSSPEIVLGKWNI